MIQEDRNFKDGKRHASKHNQKEVIITLMSNQTDCRAKGLGATNSHIWLK